MDRPTQSDALCNKSNQFGHAKRHAPSSPSPPPSRRHFRRPNRTIDRIRKKKTARTVTPFYRYARILYIKKICKSESEKVADDFKGIEVSEYKAKPFMSLTRSHSSEDFHHVFYRAHNCPKDLYIGHKDCGQSDH